MIRALLSLLLPPLDVAVRAYIVARGWMLAPLRPPSTCGCFCYDCRGGFHDTCTREYGCAPASPTCDGCGAGMGADCAPTCPYLSGGTPVAPVSPVVACCYCGKPQTNPADFINDPDGGREPLCASCYFDAEPTAADIFAKLAADRAQTAARAEEAGGLKKAAERRETAHLTFDARGYMLPCSCPIRGCAICSAAIDALAASRFAS